MNDVMRRQYRELSEDEKVLMDDLKTLGESFWFKCDQAGQSRELSLAKTKIEEAVLWAVKHVTAP